MKLKKKQRKVDHEVSDLRARLSGNSVKPIVLSNREIRLLRYIELTDEEIAKIEGSPKVAKKLERLRSHGKEDGDEEDEECEDGDYGEEESEESDTASQPRSGDYWSYVSDEPSSLTATSQAAAEPVSSNFSLNSLANNISINNNSNHHNNLNNNNNLDSIGSNVSNLSNSSSGCCCQCHLHNSGAGSGSITGPNSIVRSAGRERTASRGSFSATITTETATTGTSMTAPDSSLSPGTAPVDNTSTTAFSQPNNINDANGLSNHLSNNNGNGTSKTGSGSNGCSPKLVNGNVPLEKTISASAISAMVDEETQTLSTGE